MAGSARIHRPLIEKPQASSRRLEFAPLGPSHSLSMSAEIPGEIEGRQNSCVCLRSCSPSKWELDKITLFKEQRLFAHVAADVAPGIKDLRATWVLVLTPKHFSSGIARRPSKFWYMGMVYKMGTNRLILESNRKVCQETLVSMHVLPSLTCDTHLK